MNIPQSELDEIVQLILSHPEYLDPTYVINTYRRHVFNIIPDMFSADAVIPIKQALSDGKPLSVVRIGDGEINLLSYGAYSSTPCLNRYVVEKIVAMQNDCFKVDSLWMVILQDLMMGALMQADVIGVIGLQRFRYPNPEEIAQLFLKDYRGISGHWRAVDFMLSLANRGIFNNKTLASAHLYFSLLENLHDIIPLTKKVFIISNRKKVAEKFRQRYPNINFEYISVGKSTELSAIPGQIQCNSVIKAFWQKIARKLNFKSQRLCGLQTCPEIAAELSSRDKPDFLLSVYSILPADMSGSLSLLGAGPWAEIYCTWIKQRGGVAVDIGSGFDLLDGEITRQGHKGVGLEKVRKYAL